MLRPADQLGRSMLRPYGRKIVRTEDGYIIYKCLNGDSAAFGFLVDKYKEAVYALAYSKGKHVTSWGKMKK